MLAPSSPHCFLCRFGHLCTMQYSNPSLQNPYYAAIGIICALWCAVWIASCRVPLCLLKFNDYPVRLFTMRLFRNSTSHFFPWLIWCLITFVFSGFAIPIWASRVFLVDTFPFFFPVKKR